MKHLWRLVPLIGLIGLLLGLAAGQAQADNAQQVAISPTPVNIVLPTALPLGLTPQGAVTPTATRTPTPLGPALLEAKTEANVRAQADPNAELYGTIRAGDLYPIIGRYFRWLQFQYPTSPAGTGWVFDELVTIRGDEASIPDLTLQEAPTADTAALTGTASFLSITLTPGGLLTATANARVISIPAPAQPGQGDTAAAAPESTGETTAALNVLPTFTFPPNVIAATPTPLGVRSAAFAATPAPPVESVPLPGSVPPIVPILALGAFGILGLAISSFRR